MSRDNLKYDSPVFTLVSYLFREYLVDKDLTTEDATKVNMRSFYTWFHERGLPPEEKYELKANYGISDDEFDIFDETMSDPFEFVGAMYPSWPMLLHGLKHSPEDRPESISLSIHINWEGRSIAFPALAEVPEDVPVDGFVLAALRRMMLDMSGVFVAVGGVEGLQNMRHSDASKALIEALDTVFGPGARVLTDDEEEEEPDMYLGLDDVEDAEDSADTDVESGSGPFAIFFDLPIFLGDFDEADDYDAELDEELDDED